MQNTSCTWLSKHTGKIIERSVYGAIETSAFRSSFVLTVSRCADMRQHVPTGAVAPPALLSALLQVDSHDQF